MFANLVRAHKAGGVTIIVKAAKLNHPGSPLWDPVQNIAPLLAIMLAAVLLCFAANVLIGTAVMVLGILLYGIVIRPFILRGVHQRAIDAALGHIHNWELLWKQGGLVLRRDGVMGAICVSPSRDWREFAVHHLPFTEPPEASADFGRSTKFRRPAAEEAAFDVARRMDNFGRTEPAAG
ncbi:MAG: hypothetical protein AB7E79_14260 [Rhodospirillaceae bacterium]